MQNNNTTDTSVLVNELLKEKRAERRWKMLRSLLWLALFTYIAISIFRAAGTPSTPAHQHKRPALLRLDGMIAPGRDFSAETIVPILQKAFADKNVNGIVIDINSPGGTPVQAAIVHDAIIELKNKYHKKVIVVGEDLLTSGAYYVAVSADKIYVNASTLTGSIGVIMKGFGFVDVMKKIGIERRVYTAGSDKDRLDPFLPQNPEDLKKIQSVMAEVHQHFVQAVLEGRKGKLRVTDTNTLFTGDFWSGQAAVNLGLVDDLGNLSDVLQKEFGTDKYKDLESSSSIIKLLSGQLTSAFDHLIYAY